MKIYSFFLILQFICLFAQLAAYFIFNKPKIGTQFMYANFVFCFMFFFTKFVIQV